MDCKRCLKNVVERELIVCQGFCGAPFHVICANVDDPLREQLKNCGSNFFWMCDPCAELFSNGHFRAMLSNFDDKCSSFMPKVVQSMKEDIDKLHTALTALTAKVDAKSQVNTPYATPMLWPKINHPTEPLSTPKRRRGNNGDPVYPPSTLYNNAYGTKAIQAIKTVNLDRKQDVDMVWIYLSAFHPSTTEKEVATLVTECLSLQACDQPAVIKLVPKGIDSSMLNFVSFKIGVKQQYEDKALCCDSWPQNVRFRLFEDRRTKNVPRIVQITSIVTSSDTAPIDSNPPQPILVDE